MPESGSPGGEIARAGLVHALSLFAGRAAEHGQPWAFLHFPKSCSLGELQQPLSLSLYLDDKNIQFASSSVPIMLQSLLETLSFFS